MESKICLCVLCGIPGSGKTSFCERINHDLRRHYTIININYDKILLSQNTDKIQVHDNLLENQDQTKDNFIKTARQHVVKLVEIVVNNLMTLGTQLNFESLDGFERIDKDVRTSFLRSWRGNPSTHVKDNSDAVLFLIDDNMYLRSMRYDYYKLARQYGTGFCELFLDSSVEKALERNKLRHGRDFVSPEVIYKMSQKIERPDPEKNGWEKHCIKLIAEDMTEIIFPKIQESFANPVQPLERVNEEEQAQSKTICSRNIFHQVDLILRKCVTRSIANGKKENLDVRVISQKAIKVKENILNLLKKGDTMIDLRESSIPEVEDASKDENCYLYKHVCDLFNEQLKT